MTTTAQLCLRVHDRDYWFFRPIGGSPEHIALSLDVLRRWQTQYNVTTLEQLATWLLYIGMVEYSMRDDVSGHIVARDLAHLSPTDPTSNKKFSAWRIGAYEPCVCRGTCHLGAEWLYIVNATDHTVQICRPPADDDPPTPLATLTLDDDFTFKMKTVEKQIWYESP